MLTIVALDRLAQNRLKLVEDLHRYLCGDAKELELIPRVNIIPLAPEELKFHNAPDICVIGSGLVDTDLVEIANIRRLLPSTTLIARVQRIRAGLSLIEQLARVGIDDVIQEDLDAREFLKRIIILSKRAKTSKSGKLIVVDSGKGGVGVTSIVAGLGECIANHGSRVALLDFDFETQDLSRFLQARPFLNENLQLLFDHTRPVTHEFVEQCLVPVWDGEENLFCMTPPPESDGLFESQSSIPRTLISVFEVLDVLFEAAVIDVGSLRGAVLKTIYRLADQVVFIVNNDPATLYASIDRLRVLKAHLSAGSKLTIVFNAASKHGLSSKRLSAELSRVMKHKDGEWQEFEIPLCRNGSRWPGSGGTLLSQGGPALKRRIASLAAGLELIPASNPAKNGMLDLALSLMRRIRRSESNKALGVSSSRVTQIASPHKTIERKQISVSTESLPLPGSDAFYVSAPIIESKSVEKFDNERLVSGIKFS